MTTEIDLQDTSFEQSCDPSELSEYNQICESEEDYNTIHEGQDLIETIHKYVEWLWWQGFDEKSIYNSVKEKYSHILHDFYYIIDLVGVDYNSDDDGMSDMLESEVHSDEDSVNDGDDVEMSVYSDSE